MKDGMTTATTDSPTPAAPAPSGATPAPSSPASSSPPSSTASTATSGAAAAPASDRPTDAKSLSAFLQKKDAAADGTTPQAPLVTDAAAAAITPLTTTPAPGGPDPTAAKGPIPFDVHHTALANARTNAVAEFKKTLGPVADFKPDQTAWLIDMAARMKDPLAFHRWFGEQLQAHPTYGQQLRPAAPAAVKPQPDVQIRDDAGNIVGMSYSADRQAALLTWEREQLTGEFKQLLQPFQQERETRLQQERTAAQQKDLNARADATLGRVNKILGLDALPKEEQAALGKKLLDELSRTPDAVEAALNLFEREIRPGLEAKGHDKAVETHRQKAAANTANGSGAASSATRPTTAKELAKWMAANDGR